MSYYGIWNLCLWFPGQIQKNPKEEESSQPNLDPSFHFGGHMQPAWLQVLAANAKDRNAEGCNEVKTCHVEKWKISI